MTPVREYLATLPNRCARGFAPIQHPRYCACRETPADQKAADYAYFKVALVEAAVDGVVHQSKVRPLVRGRIAPKQIVGPIPTGMTVDHICFNRACVEPSHLRLLTHVENARRQRTAIATVCAKGHDYTPENTIYREGGRRRCRQCENAGQRRRHAS